MSQTELQVAFDKLAKAFGKFDELLRRKDKHEWERWKAGGKAVTSEFVSMYPSAEEIAENDEEDDDEDDIDDEEEGEDDE